MSYTESGNFSTDLNRLTNSSDGFMDNVHALRNTYGADLVSLIIEGTSLCGLGWLMTTESNSFQALAFSVVARICATGNFSFGHELGHNMGLQHDRMNTSSDGVFPFSHGYVDIPNSFPRHHGRAASLMSQLHSHTKFFQSKRYFQRSSHWDFTVCRIRRMRQHP